MRAIALIGILLLAGSTNCHQFVRIVRDSGEDVDSMCHGVDDGCCTEDEPCDEGDGDCDSDEECALPLVCGVDNCDREDGFDSTDDCCERFVDSEGRCVGGDDCCTYRRPCAEGQGDCDDHEDCAEGLKCGSNNCKGSSFDFFDDCCEQDGSRQRPYTPPTMRGRRR